MVKLSRRQMGLINDSDSRERERESRADSTALLCRSSSSPVCPPLLLVSTSPLINQAIQNICLFRSLLLSSLFCHTRKRSSPPLCATSTTNYHTHRHLRTPQVCGQTWPLPYVGLLPGWVIVVTPRHHPASEVGMLMRGARGSFNTTSDSARRRRKRHVEHATPLGDGRYVVDTRKRKRIYRKSAVSRAVSIGHYKQNDRPEYEEPYRCRSIGSSGNEWL